MNKKGFIFAETIIVLVVLSIGLIMLYSLFNRILITEKRKTKYDSTQDLYYVYHIKTFLSEHGLESCFYDFEAGQMYSKVKTSDDGPANEDECNLFEVDSDEKSFYYELLTVLEVKEIYITNYDVKYLKNNEALFRLVPTLMNYISTLSAGDDAEGNYRIIVKFEDDRYASLKINNTTTFNNLSNYYAMIDSEVKKWK